MAPAERIAVFDNDGTLWCEKPLPVQLFFVLDRVKTLAPQHPEWKDKEPFASLLKGDLRAVLAGGPLGIMAAFLVMRYQGINANILSLGGIAIVQFGLVVQLISSIVMVVGGARAKGDTIEFFAYILVALIVPLGAAFWALIERTRWSTFVLGVGALTAAIMLVRMHQIWFG